MDTQRKGPLGVTYPNSPLTRPPIFYQCLSLSKFKNVVEYSFLARPPFDSWGKSLAS